MNKLKQSLLTLAALLSMHATTAQVQKATNTPDVTIGFQSFATPNDGVVPGGYVAFSMPNDNQLGLGVHFFPQQFDTYLGETGTYSVNPQMHTPVKKQGRFFVPTTADDSQAEFGRSVFRSRDIDINAHIGLYFAKDSRVGVVLKPRIAYIQNSVSGLVANDPEFTTSPTVFFSGGSATIETKLGAEKELTVGVGLDMCKDLTRMQFQQPTVAFSIGYNLDINGR